jgi:O-antigen/teichoic acid export membrane protein
MAASVAIQARLAPQAWPVGPKLVEPSLLAPSLVAPRFVAPEARRPQSRAAPVSGNEEARALAASQHVSLRNQALLAFSIRVGSAGLSYASQILFARLLGVEAFGVFSVAWAFVLVLGHVAPCGFAESAVRFLPRYQLRGKDSEARGFIAIGGETVLIGGAAIALGGGIVLLFVPAGDFSWPILGALACIMPFAYQVWLEGLARGLDRPGLALACPYLLRPVLMAVVLGVAALFGHATAGAAVLAALLSTFATVAIQEVLVGRAARRALGDGKTRTFPAVWLKASAPLAGGTACGQATYYADILALGLMRSPAEAAIYIAASRTLALASFAQYALSMVSGRRFAVAKAVGGNKALAALTTASTRLTVLASLAAVAVVLLAGGPLLALFGQLFSTAYPVLIVLSIGAMARALPGQKEAVLTVLGFQRELFLISLATLIVAIVANLALIGPLGATGAACASTLAVIFRSALIMTLSRLAFARGRTSQ